MSRRSFLDAFWLLFGAICSNLERILAPTGVLRDPKIHLFDIKLKKYKKIEVRKKVNLGSEFYEKSEVSEEQQP